MPEETRNLASGGLARPPARDMVMYRGELGSDKLVSCLAGFAVAIPGKGKISGGSEIDAAWMSPDELLLMGPVGSGSKIRQELSAAMHGTHHLVADVSSMRAEFEIFGPVRDILARGTPVDLSPAAFAVGDFRRSRVGQIQAAFWLLDGASARLLCRRSEAGYLARWLELATTEGCQLGFYDS